MANELFGAVPTFVGIIIGMILSIVLYRFYYCYKMENQIVDQAYFVMFYDDCCNPYKSDYKPGSQCKKYCTGQLFEKIFASIQSARASICICMFNFTNQRLARCIGYNARKHDINVRVILDKSTTDGNDDRMQTNDSQNSRQEDKNKKTTVAEILKEKGMNADFL